MYCRNCGNELHDGAAYCYHCGCAVDNGQYQAPQPYQSQPTQEPQKSNTVAVIGFVLAFFMPVIGLICSIIGLKNAPQCDGNGKGLAIAGIIISAIEIITIIIVVIIFVVILGSFISADDIYDALSAIIL